MLTLALLRHAKSSWDQPGLNDIDRPLNARGIAAAPVIGREIARLKLNPDLILCSTAKRTRETLALALPKAAAGATPVLFEEALYMASAERLIERLQRVPGNTRTVLLIGHNPSLHNLALALAGRGEPDSLKSLADAFPTGALAILEFDAADWHGLATGQGRLVHFTTPRRLSAA